MVIAVNTISFLKNTSRGETAFFFETFSRLAKQYPQHTFLFIFDAPYDEGVIFSENVQPVITRAFPAKLLLWKLWYDYNIPGILKKYKADVFISAGICSLRTKVPQCLVLGDISFLNHPLLGLKEHLNFYRKNIAKFLRKAQTIVTLTDFSREQIVEKYKVQENKIDVVPAAANELFVPVSFEEREMVKEKYADGNEYFLFSGEIAAKNNLVNLLKAFSFFKKRQKSSMQLIICGAEGFKNEEFKESLRLFKFNNEVKIYHDLVQSELANLTASAYAFVYPSFFLQFDTATVEAMKCNVPLVVSDIEIMRQVCGDAALYANPDNHKLIAEKMMLVFKDEDLRKQLIEKGQQRVQYYNWDRTASILWESILKTCA